MTLVCVNSFGELETWEFRPFENEWIILADGVWTVYPPIKAPLGQLDKLLVHPQLFEREVLGEL